MHSITCFVLAIVIVFVAEKAKPVIKSTETAAPIDKFHARIRKEFSTEESKEITPEKHALLREEITEAIKLDRILTAGEKSTQW